MAGESLGDCCSPQRGTLLEAVVGTAAKGCRRPQHEAGEETHQDWVVVEAGAQLFLGAEAPKFLSGPDASVVFSSFFSFSFIAIDKKPLMKDKLRKSPGSVTRISFRVPPAMNAFPGQRAAVPGAPLRRPDDGWEAVQPSLGRNGSIVLQFAVTFGVGRGKRPRDGCRLTGINEQGKGPGTGLGAPQLSAA
ncbi:hypothetical protein NDU88_000834 [Pleurodeles waltl]|uniref:Uncharacterized protein n=1 Tax=Pleurodeles waltl TaxID=8319 RepID=A0AAV7S6T3_PLEWA|nr:hypothetical protein NDU88_000834 [Pleurodeles waltl]